MSAQQEDRPLPLSVRRDLDRAAAGIGRVATAAHPDCRCGKPYLPGCRACGAKVNQPCREADHSGYPYACPPRLRRTGGPKDCPQHRPGKR